MRPYLECAVVAFLLHLGWEMAQMDLYRGLADQPWTKTLGRCSVAAAFDVVVTLALAVPFVHLVRRWPRPSWAWAGMAAAGGLVAIVIERAGLASGRWSYAETMPFVPLVDVGVVPVLQMMVIPPLAGWLTLRPSRQGRLGR